MTYEHITEILRIIVPVLIALITVGGGAYGYFVYKSSKPKTTAEAKKLNAEVLVTFADGWENLYREVLEKVKALENMIEVKDQAHAMALSEKNAKIDELEARIIALEEENARYRGVTGVKIETAKNEIKKKVDEELTDIKKKIIT